MDAYRKISAAEAIRNFGRVQEEAAQGPVILTHHGRPRLAMLSMEALERLQQGTLSGEDAAQRNKLLLILDAISEGYMSLDRNWRYVTINRTAELFLGRPRDELLGRVWTKAFPMARGTEAEQHLRRAMDEGQVVHFAWDSVVHPGRRIEVQAFPIPLPEGGIAVIFTNIGDRERLERRARRAEALLDAVAAERDDMALIVHDGDGLVSQWSAGAERLLGWTASEMASRSSEELHPAEEREAGTMWRDIAHVRRERRLERTVRRIARSGEVAEVREVLSWVDRDGGFCLRLLSRPPSAG